MSALNCLFYSPNNSNPIQTININAENVREANQANQELINELNTQISENATTYLTNQTLLGIGLPQAIAIKTAELTDLGRIFYPPTEDFTSLVVPANPTYLSGENVVLFIFNQTTGFDTGLYIISYSGLVTCDAPANIARVQLNLLDEVDSIVYSQSIFDNNSNIYSMNTQMVMEITNSNIGFSLVMNANTLDGADWWILANPALPSLNPPEYAGLGISVLKIK